MRAGWGFSALGAAVGLQSSAGDALFIRAFGPGPLGTAFAASSVVLMIVLAGIGLLSDRRSRRVVLLATCGAGVLLSLAVGGLAAFHSTAGGALAIVVGKQLAAATDLALWVLLAERLSATAIRRHMPRFVIHHGAGVAVGAVVVGPAARMIGIDGAFALGSVGFAAAAFLFVSSAPLRRAISSRPGGRRRGGFLAPFRDSGLARGLAAVVFAGGLFAPILYYLAAGAVASAHPGDATAVAEVLGWFRGGTQVATIAAQFMLTPWLLSRLGVSGSLVTAPAVALLGASLVLAMPVLAVVLAAQAAVRVFDAACDDPAEKLAMNLLPPAVRGRVGGALDGLAKRAGSVLGGLLASALSTTVLLWSTLGMAFLWFVMAARFARRLPTLAVRELAAQAPRAEPVAPNFASTRGIARLRRELRGAAGVETAVELIAQLSQTANLDFVETVADALADPECLQPEKLLRRAQLLALQQPDIVKPVRREAATAGLDQRWQRQVERMHGEPSSTDLAGIELAFSTVGAALRGDSSSITGLLRAHRSGTDHERAAIAQALASCVRLSRADDAMWVLSRSAVFDAARAWPDRFSGPRWHDVAHRVAALQILACAGDADDDIALAARLLADAEETVANEAAVFLEAKGGRALEALLLAASLGRRRGRDRALVLLSQLPAHRAQLDALIGRELDDLATTAVRVAPLAKLPAGQLLCRRLRERVDEIVRTLLLALEARYRNAAIGEAGALCLAARSDDERARPLEVLHAALPAGVRDPVVVALDPAPDDERAQRMAKVRGLAVPAAEEAVAAEIAGRDPLSRAFAVHALGQEGRARFRQEITDAATRAAQTYDAAAIVKRLVDDASFRDDMPGEVEAVLALRQVPLFAELTTRELSELASVVTWQRYAAGERVVEEGDDGDAMYFVVTGSVRVTRDGEPTAIATLGPGEPFGELTLFDDVPRVASVVADTDISVGRIARAEFGDLVDQIPGIALAICRVLSRRLRAQSTHST